MTILQNSMKKAREIQAQFDLLSQKISRLRRAFAIETDPANKFKLEKQLEEAETEREQLEQQLTQLQHDLETYQTQATLQTTTTGVPQIDSDMVTDEEREPEIDVHLKKIQEVDEVTGIETDTTPEGSAKVKIEDVKKGKKVTGMTIKKMNI
jgi:hypothetical protein